MKLLKKLLSNDGDRNGLNQSGHSTCTNSSTRSSRSALQSIFSRSSSKGDLVKLLDDSSDESCGPEMFSVDPFGADKVQSAVCENNHDMLLKLELVPDQVFSLSSDTNHCRSCDDDQAGDEVAESDHSADTSLSDESFAEEEPRSCRKQTRRGREEKSTTTPSTIRQRSQSPKRRAYRNNDLRRRALASCSPVRSGRTCRSPVRRESTTISPTRRKSTNRSQSPTRPPRPGRREERKRATVIPPLRKAPSRSVSHKIQRNRDKSPVDPVGRLPSRRAPPRSASHSTFRSTSSDGTIPCDLQREVNLRDPTTETKRDESVGRLPSRRAPPRSASHSTFRSMTKPSDGTVPCDLHREVDLRDSNTEAKRDEPVGRLPSRRAPPRSASHSTFRSMTKPSDGTVPCREGDLRDSNTETKRDEPVGRLPSRRAPPRSASHSTFRSTTKPSDGTASCDLHREGDLRDSNTEAKRDEPVGRLPSRRAPPRSASHSTFQSTTKPSDGTVPCDLHREVDLRDAPTEAKHDPHSRLPSRRAPPRSASHSTFRSTTKPSDGTAPCDLHREGDLRDSNTETKRDEPVHWVGENNGVCGHIQLALPDLAGCGGPL